MNTKIPCPQCKAENFESSLVCWQCGSPLKQQPEAQQTQQMQAQPASQYNPGTPNPNNYPNQAPGAAPSPYPPSAYAGGYPQSSVPRPVALSVMMVISWISSGVLLLMGLAFMVLGPSIASHVPGQTDANVAPIVGGVMIFLGIIFLVVAAVAAFITYKVWMGYQWARIVFIACAILGILGGLQNVTAKAPPNAAMLPTQMQAAMTSNHSMAWIGLLLNIAFVVVLFLPQTGEYCKS